MKNPERFERLSELIASIEHELTLKGPNEGDLRASLFGAWGLGCERDLAEGNPARVAEILESREEMNRKKANPRKWYAKKMYEGR
jgi:hypothetical protein